MKTLTKRLENLLTINDTDTKKIVIYKLRIYEWLLSLCDMIEEVINKKDIN